MDILVPVPKFVCKKLKLWTVVVSASIQLLNRAKSEHTSFSQTMNLTSLSPQSKVTLLEAMIPEFKSVAPPALCTEFLNECKRIFLMRQVAHGFQDTTCLLPLFL